MLLAVVHTSSALTVAIAVLQSQLRLCQTLNLYERHVCVFWFFG
jgi:hypothetical protein